MTQAHYETCGVCHGDHGSRPCPSRDAVHRKIGPGERVHKLPSGVVLKRAMVPPPIDPMVAYDPNSDPYAFARATAAMKRKVAARSAFTVGDEERAGWAVR